MTEKTREEVYLIPGKDTIFAVPVTVCQAYALEGKALEAARIALSGDVVGQNYDPYALPAANTYYGYGGYGGNEDFVLRGYH